MRDELLLKQLPIIEQRLDKCLVDYSEKWSHDSHYTCEVTLRLRAISITIFKVVTWKWHFSKKTAYHLRVKTHGAHEITRGTSNAQEKQYAKEIISLYEKAVHKFYAEKAEKFIEDDGTLMVYVRDSLGTF